MRRNMKSTTRARIDYKGAKAERMRNWLKLNKSTLQPTAHAPGTQNILPSAS